MRFDLENKSLREIFGKVKSEIKVEEVRHFRIKFALDHNREFLVPLSNAGICARWFCFV
jgi:hypothetical protein